MAELTKILAPLVIPAVFAALNGAFRLIDPRIARHRQLHRDFEVASAHPNSRSFAAADAALASYIDEAKRFANGYRVAGQIRAGNVAATVGTVLIAGAVAIAGAEANTGAITGLPETCVLGGIVLYALALLAYGAAFRLSKQEGAMHLKDGHEAEHHAIEHGESRAMPAHEASSGENATTEGV